MISLQTQGLEHKEGIGGSVVSVGPEKIGIRFRDPWEDRFLTCYVIVH